MRSSIKAALTLCFTLLASPALATTYYVSVSTGNDTTGTGTESLPWKSIQKCVLSGSPLVAGDTCLVKSGTYTNVGDGSVPGGFKGRTVVIGSSSPVATAANPITLKSEVPLGAIIETPSVWPGLNCEVSSCPFAGIYISGGGSNYIIDGFTFTAPGSTQLTNASISGVTILSAETGIHVVNNDFNDIARNVCSNSIFGNVGIHGNRTSGVLIEKNIFRVIGRKRNGEGGCSTTIFGHDHGIYFEASTDLTIRYNLCYDVNRGACVVAKARVSGTKTLRLRIYNNTFADQSPTTKPEGQISLSNSHDDTQIKNNIFRNPEGGYLVWAATPPASYALVPVGAGVIIQNNLSDSTNAESNIVLNQSSFSLLTVSGNILNTSPGFTDESSRDYTLASGSAAINAGQNVGLPYSGSAPDIGRYESFTRTGASINGRTITMTTDSLSGLQTSGTTGWTANCTGCGTPVVAGISAQVGQSSTLQFDISGITGDSCAGGQTWTISRSGTTHPVTNTAFLSVTNQSLHGFTNYAVTNVCTGGPSGPPAGVTIHHAFDENTGTTANDSEGGDQNGTLTGGASWGTGISGSGVSLTPLSGQYVAIDYGNAVDLGTQDLTIAFWINISPGTELLARSWFGAPLGIDTRLFIVQSGGSVRIGIKDSNGALASDLAVTSGWHHACLTMNATTKVATMHLDGIAATASGGVKSYVGGYVLAGDFTLGQISGINEGAGGVFEDFYIYPSVEDCAQIMQSIGSVPTESGSFTQTAFRFEAVRLKSNGSVEARSSNNVAVYECVEEGAVALTLEFQCDNVSNCSSTSFPLAYSTNGTDFSFLVPLTPTSDGVSLYGSDSDNSLNRFATSGALASGLTHVSGGTILTPAEQQSYDLAQNTSLTVRYLLKFASGTAGRSYWFRSKLGSGASMGTYSNTPRVNVISKKANGGH